MVKKIVYFTLTFLLLISCTEQGKWEIIKSNPPTYGIPTEQIYFQNEKSGIFGGYGLVENQNSNNFDKLDQIPVIFLTNSLGKSYDRITMPKNTFGNIYKLFLKDKIIVCQIENSIYKTENLGKNWLKIYQGNIESFNFEIYNENKMFFIVKNKTKKYLVKYENKKIDTLKSFDNNSNIIITKGKLFTYSEYKTKTILVENIENGIIDTLNLDKNYSMNYIKQLNKNKCVIASENQLFIEENKKIIPLNPTFLNSFYIKDILCNDSVIITICKERNTKNALTDDIYFVSYDYGKNWKELQRELGSNKKKFLYKTKQLISYESPYGLQRIKL